MSPEMFPSPAFLTGNPESIARHHLAQQSANDFMNDIKDASQGHSTRQQVVRERNIITYTQPMFHYDSDRPTIAILPPEHEGTSIPFLFLQRYMSMGLSNEYNVIGFPNNSFVNQGAVRLRDADWMHMYAHKDLTPQSDLILDVIEKKEIDELHLVGIQGGATTAANVAALNADRDVTEIASMTLINPPNLVKWKRWDHLHSSMRYQSRLAARKAIESVGIPMLRDLHPEFYATTALNQARQTIQHKKNLMPSRHVPGVMERAQALANGKLLSDIVYCDSTPTNIIIPANSSVCPMPSPSEIDQIKENFGATVTPQYHFDNGDTSLRGKSVGDEIIYDSRLIVNSVRRHLNSL